MMRLVKLSLNDGEDVYNMLKGIREVENSFTNPTYEMTFTQFKRWLIKQKKWENGEDLPDGYVPQSIYWFYMDEIPIGIGKIRSKLTPESRINGGSIGYAISKEYRGQGYGKILLRLLLSEAKKMRVEEILLTVNKDNIASKQVCLDNGGVIVSDTDDRYYIQF